MEIEDLKKLLESKDIQFRSIQESLKLKDDQIKTIMDSLHLKDEQVKTLESSLKIKDQKIETLEKTIKLKDEQNKIAGGSSVDEDDLKQKDAEIKDLKKQVEVLNTELAKADEDLEKLEADNDSMRKSGSTGGTGQKIMDFTDLQITKPEVIEKMRGVLQKALHNVTIVVPNITDLQELRLYEVRSSVNMKIACLINPGEEEHASLLQEFESLDNVSIRSFEGEDRFVLIRDGEELLFGATGKSDNILVFNTRDASHIKLFNSLVMEGWLRSRKL